MDKLEKAKRDAFNRAANETYRLLTHRRDVEDSDDWPSPNIDWDEIPDVDWAEVAGQQEAESAVEQERLFETDAEGTLQEVDEFGDNVEVVDFGDFYEEALKGTPRLGCVTRDFHEAESLRLFIKK